MSGKKRSSQTKKNASRGFRAATKRRVLLATAVLAMTVVLTVGSTLATSKTHSNVDHLDNDALDIQASVENIEKETGKPPLVTTTNPGVSVETTIHASGGTNPRTDVIVNGKPLNVPKNGTVHKVYESKNGTTEVNISSNATSSGGSGSWNVTHFNVSTNSDSYDTNFSP